MSKEKVKEKRTKLSKDEFHQWRSSIYEMHEAKHLAQIAELEHGLLRKGIEVLDLKSQLFAKNKVDNSKLRVEASKGRYDVIKESLEKNLGYSLSEMVIDEITLEIKKV